ncbi:unnamed protein product [Zymoseptoria tritici ST99CH_1A5]|uniref:Uncharacterized protein n=2 Tax=Zymoseptoria tritici TaxID=1047171 RepID=F9XKA5_ZYMTI|nr:uncharacterized protein MYCGRDRAFT_95738 [Zymoseptoria tritici IPO323]EGP84674.1 hypothetical protein MYCGRDRAFT_95738 [Zymoseptoria tritici IPO323]SMR61511.1 unnamed protein product [Zymoseptoria tritici ST99CH_3D1]SMY27722.1 unnamed protein product [Zymoseptoria tritici ST99CH_1A5]
MFSSLVNSVKTEYNSFNMWPFKRSSEDPSLKTAPPSRLSEALAQKDRARPWSPTLASTRGHSLRISTRTIITTGEVILQGWPSRGGLIELQGALAPDFEYLKLNSIDPPLRRDPDQEAEDEFCRGLLRLGATWWASDRRRNFVHRLESQFEDAIEACQADESLDPSRLERGWVRVAWPSEPAGSLCVLECGRVNRGRRGNEIHRPRQAGLLLLARTMDERCEMLKMFG